MRPARPLPTGAAVVVASVLVLSGASPAAALGTRCQMLELGAASRLARNVLICHARAARVGEAVDAGFKVIRTETAFDGEVTIGGVAVPITGRIDRIDQADDGRFRVIDYKSGKPDEIRLERDRHQVARYCEAIGKMTGEPCSGALWYVDVDGETVVAVGQPLAVSS